MKRDGYTLTVNDAGCGCGCNGADKPGEVHCFRVNFAASGSRRAKYEGRETLIVPVVMLRETVVNGAFVAASELNASGWNGVPVTVSHPKDDAGQHITANTPDARTKWGVGFIFNAKVESAKLKGEAWIDVERANKLAPGLIEALEAGKEIDVSTGYFSGKIKTNGEHDGKPYAFTHHDIIPDHLALLPNEQGACSWADGCGVRANQGIGMTDRVEKFFTALRAIINEGGKGNAMNENERNAAIEKIAANSKVTAEAAAKFDDATLTALADSFPMKAKDEKKDDDEKKDGEKKPAANADAPVTMAALTQAFEGFAKQIPTIVTNTIAEQDRPALVEKLVANKMFSKPVADAMSIEALREAANAIKAPADYSARGGAAPLTALSKDDPLLSAAPLDMGAHIRANHAGKKEAA